MAEKKVYRNKFCCVCRDEYTPTGARQTHCAKCKQEKQSGAKPNFKIKLLYFDADDISWSY